MPDAVRRFIWLGLFTLLTLALFGPALARRDAVLGSPVHNDIVKQFAPFHAFYQRALRGGEWPLWNPHIMAGMPVAMFGQSGLFYPPDWPALLLPPHDAMDVRIALHFLLALGGTFWIARRLGLRRAAAATAAIAWALSGATVGRLIEGHVTVIAAMAWFPMAWGGLYRSLAFEDAAERGRDTATGIAGFTAMGLCGAPQFWAPALMVAGLTAGWVILGGAEGRPRWAWRRQVALRSALVLGAPILLSAVEWLPVAAVSGQTARAQLAPEFEDAEFDLRPAELATILLPNLIEGQSSEHRTSVGMVATILALVGLLRFPDRRLAWTLVAVGLIALWLGMGTRAGLYPLLKFLLPPLGVVSGGHRFLFAFSFALSLGAGLGVEAICRSLETRSEGRAAAAAGAGLAAAVLVSLLLAHARHFTLMPATPDLEVPHPLASILSDDPQGRRVLNLVPELMNQSLIHGYDDINGYGVTMPADFARVAAWGVGDEPRAAHWAHFNKPTPSFCYWTGAGYLIAYAGDRPDPARWERLWGDARVALWRLKQDWPRAQACARVRFVDRAQAAAMAQSRPPGPPDEVMIEGTPPAAAIGKPAGAGAPAAVTLTERTVNRRRWRVTNLPAPGWLLIRETWTPDWRARVNGCSSPACLAQFSLCAVALPAGDSVVELRYRPWSFAIGLAITGAAALLIMATGRFRRFV